MAAAVLKPPAVDCVQLAAAVMLAACCGMDGNVAERNHVPPPASKLAGPTAAASCRQSTVCHSGVAHWVEEFPERAPGV